MSDTPSICADKKSDITPLHPSDGKGESPEAIAFWEALIPENEAAAFLCVSHRTLKRWRYDGGGPRFVVLSRQVVRYRRVDLKDFLERHMATSTSGGGGPQPDAA